MNTKLLVDRLKQYPLAVVCLVIFLAAIVLVVVRGSVLPELRTAESELGMRLRTIERNAENASDLEAEVSALEAKIAEIEPRLFDSNERALNTSFFYSFEDRVDVLITGVSQQSSDEGIFAKGGPNRLKLYSVLVYKISLEGTFQQFLSFLHALHTADPFIRVADLQLSEAGRSDSGSDQLAATVRVLVLAKND